MLSLLDYPKITGNPLIDIPLFNRGITEQSEIEFNLKQLLPIQSLTGVSEVAEKLYKAIQNKKRIVIIGDYDCDGATATAVMIKALKSLNANFGWLIPNRELHGYGLSENIVNDAYNGWVTGDIQHLPEIEHQVIEKVFDLVRDDDFSRVNEKFKEDDETILQATIGNIQSNQTPDVILTVDNGIANLAGVAKANELGLQVLITDHHLAGKELPLASAIVNPNHPNSTFKSKALCGVGVAWYVVCELSKLAKKDGVNTLNVLSLLPYVALGTVADVVPLDHNNRLLVDIGLKLTRNIKDTSCLGLQYLSFANNKKLNKISTSDIGFTLAPCINAAGRIKNMGVGVLNLITENAQIAQITAYQLMNLNAHRKAITSQVVDQSVEQIIQLQSTNQQTQYVIVCYPDKHEHWHEGVVGIAAGQIKEKLNKPTVVLTYIADKQLYKGSCRSIPALHFKDLLDEVNLADPDIFVSFGGHAMAAGVSVKEDKIEDFARIINEKAKQKLSIKDFKRFKLTDGALPLSCLNLQAIEAMSLFIWGQNFPAPVFHYYFTVLEVKRMGSENQHVRLKLKADNKILTGVRFNVPEWDVTENTKIGLLYQPAINEFNGYTNIQLMIQDDFKSESELTNYQDFLQ